MKARPPRPAPGRRSSSSPPPTRAGAEATASPDLEACPPRWRVVEGDGPSLLADLEAGGAGAVITDPPWPNGGERIFGVDPDALFARLCREVPRVTKRFVVVLGTFSDPRLLRHVPAELPFVRSCRLRYVMPGYVGIHMNDGDVAYLFGHFAPPRRPRRVLPGECLAWKHRDTSVAHPTPRRVEHMAWLADHYTLPDDLIVDPFCGSGATGAGAVRMGRRFLGFEINPAFAAEARERLALEAAGVDPRATAAGQTNLFR